MNVSSSSGALSESNPNLQILNGEVTHSAPIPAASDHCGDVVSWTVPSATASATLFAAGYAKPGGTSKANILVSPASFASTR